MAATIFEKHKNAYVKHALEFQRVFGKRLKDYHDIVFGFDIMKFETDFDLEKTAEGKSIADVLTERYGKNVCEMIRELL